MPKYQQKSKSIASAEPDYFVHFARRYPVYSISHHLGSPENLNLCLPKENVSSKEIIMIRDCNPFLKKTYINSICNLE